ncbi:MAG TPA: DUF302 domain-containing protein [Flavisolibacter sp.]
MTYHFSKTIQADYEQAIAALTKALQAEGFGVISTIDLKEKFKEKLEVDFRQYTILGACNPKLAYEAIQLEPHIGVMLPCNILVQEKDSNSIEITAINPMETMQAVQNEKLSTLAADVSRKLHNVINTLS